MSNEQIKFSSLSPKWQDLVRRMQRLNFGYLRNLRICEGEPELRDDFESMATYRFPGENSPRPESKLKDFVLQAEIREFIEALEDMYFRRIAKVQVRHGLPFQMEVDDPE